MPTDKLLDSVEIDRDLRQRVKAHLHQCGYGPHKSLEVYAERGVVVVQGWVPTFYLRQIAIECIKRVEGVAHVVDLINVMDGPVDPQATDSPTDGRQSSVSSQSNRMDLLDTARTGHALQCGVSERQVLC